MVAGHVIEKQIEQMRMMIAESPDDRYAAFSTGLHDTTIIDTSTHPNVTVLWHKSSLTDPGGSQVMHVTKVDLTASWGSGTNDTLRVTTTISKDF